MTLIKGYWVLYNTKSAYRPLNVSLRSKRVEKLRRDLQKYTGNAVSFYKIER
jgi:hypothetical protein